MKKFLVQMMALVVACVALVSCGGEQAKKGEYTNIIPEKAIALVEINGYEVVSESGILEFIEPLREEIAESLQDAAGGVALKSLVLDLDNSGIATTAPMYIFVEGNSIENIKVVAVAKVNDKKKLDQLVSFITDEVTDEVKCTKSGNNNIISFAGVEDAKIAYNSSAIVAVATIAEHTSLDNNTVSQILDRSLTPRKTKFQPSNANLAIHAWADPIFALIEKSEIQNMNDDEVEIFNNIAGLLKGAKVSCLVKLEEGKAKSSLSLTGIKSEELKQIIDAIGKVNGDFNSLVAKSALAVLDINISEELIELVNPLLGAWGENIEQRLEKTQEELKNTFDEWEQEWLRDDLTTLEEEYTAYEKITAMLNSMGGDITMALNNLKIDEDFELQALKALAAVKTKNADIYDIFREGLLALGAEGYNPDITNMELFENGIDFKLSLANKDDKATVLTINDNGGEKNPSMTEATWYNAVKGKNGFLVFDIAEIVKQIRFKDLLYNMMLNNDDYYYDDYYYEYNDDEEEEEIYKLACDIIDLYDYLIMYCDKTANSITFASEVGLKDASQYFAKPFADIIIQKIESEDYYSQIEKLILGKIEDLN